MILPLKDRLLAKFEVDEDTGCWVWHGGTAKGYGVIRAHGRQQQAHRISYELFVGPIPEGLDIDHLCRNRPCVNPAHLEPVTRRENLFRGDTIPARNAAKTHCGRGHEYTPDNTVFARDGSRDCKTCRNERRRRNYDENRDARNATRRARASLRRAAV
jgi:hypothetical protein